MPPHNQIQIKMDYLLYARGIPDRAGERALRGHASPIQSL